MSEDDERELEHAWRYFALHAQQRMTVFNFYVASAGLALTGLAWTLADGSGKWPLGATAGIGAAALSFLFWRLDQRGAQLVKVAEDAMAALESALPVAASVVNAERRLATNAGWMALSTPWTFGRSFRLLFAVVSLLGIAGAIATTWFGIRGTLQAQNSCHAVVEIASSHPLVAFTTVQGAPPVARQSGDAGSCPPASKAVAPALAPAAMPTR